MTLRSLFSGLGTPSQMSQTEEIVRILYTTLEIQNLYILFYRSTNAVI